MDIAQVLYAGSWGEVTPETIEKGLGGRETAMIKLAEAWAEAGHRVTNFVNVERGRRFYPEYLGAAPRMFSNAGFHEYVPITLTGAMLGNMPWDAVVAWEIPSVFKDEKVRENARVRICEMQVAHFTDQEVFAANVYCDYVAALSEWHSGFMQASGLDMENGEVVVLPNGVDMSRYPVNDFTAKRKNYEVKPNPKFIYSSSPDRGLWPLLRMWPLIRKSYPEAELFVTYGLTDYVNTLKWAHSRQAEMCLELEELIKQYGVRNVGKVGQKELAKMQLSADAWLYPLDALAPTETGCITAVENAAAGNPLVISNGDCLAEEFGDFSAVVNLPIDEDEYVSKLQKVLGDVNLHREMQTRGREFAETRSWRRIANQWLQLIENAHS